MIKVLELFAGIGACSTALTKLNIDFEIVDAVEIDKYAIASFNKIHNTNFLPQDISTWDKNIATDLIMHGSPCQDFSLAGKQAGGDKNSGTRSSLLYETIRIVSKLKPKYVIWENVKNVLSKKHIHNFNNYINELEKLGYKNYYKILNAKDYGIPQNRERVFTISIRSDVDKGSFLFPNKQELKLKLKNLLELNVDEKYYLSEKMKNYILDVSNKQQGTKWENRANGDTLNSDIAHTLSVRSASGNQRAGVSNFIIDNYTEPVKVRDLKKEKDSSYSRNFGCRGKLQKDICNTLVASMGTGGGNIPIIPLKIKNATKKGYQKAIDGDSVNLSYPTSNTRRGRVGYQISQTIQCNNNIGVVTKEQKNDHNDLRIRKLTPKECWRLMGFSDDDFEKAKKINSNSQLYKQAGNSIVVNVLEAILSNLLLDNKKGINIDD